MKITYKEKKKVIKTIYATDIPTGTVFCGNITGSCNKIEPFLRFYGGIVCLNDPAKVWTKDLRCVCVENYLPVEAELIVYE